MRLLQGGAYWVSMKMTRFHVSPATPSMTVGGATPIGKLIANIWPNVGLGSVSKQLVAKVVKSMWSLTTPTQGIRVRSDTLSPNPSHFGLFSPVIC